MLLPRNAGLGEADLDRDKSPARLMMLAAEAVLLAESRSAVGAVALAVLVNFPGVVGVAVMVTVAVVLTSRLPRLHVTTPLVWANVPCDGEAETNATPTGRVS